ncbi:hypothetical protein OMW55_00470 [Sphingomonas sp. BN140010]|uniref:Uncharacterized protein n=1 Tax=Sphingomonas arvum TaxID=2992113 RepID=A0ABT3JB40_9SPHN|nr:hypothetical protein [Sphingomonas sp. BN140010]MCW3796284.1 hypothetical protein [Sphingomonas sp. BN140010]
MSDGSAPTSVTAHDAETVFRPLMLATAGAGVMVLGLLQFGADMFGQLGPDGRTYMVLGIRSAFFTFIGTSAALLAAYLSRAFRAPRLSTLFNTYGAVTFLAGAFLAGGQVGVVLGQMSGPLPQVPLASGLFFLFTMTGAGLLCAAALGHALLRRWRRRSGLAATVESGVA